MYRSYDSYAPDDRRHQTPPFPPPLPDDAARRRTLSGAKGQPTTANSERGTCHWRKGTEVGTGAALRTADNPLRRRLPIPTVRPTRGANPTTPSVPLPHELTSPGQKTRGPKHATAGGTEGGAAPDDPPRGIRPHALPVRGTKTTPRGGRVVGRAQKEGAHRQAVTSRATKWGEVESAGRGTLPDCLGGRTWEYRQRSQFGSGGRHGWGKRTSRYKETETNPARQAVARGGDGGRTRNDHTTSHAPHREQDGTRCWDDSHYRADNSLPPRQTGAHVGRYCRGRRTLR